MVIVGGFWLLSSIGGLAYCSVEFFIDQQFDECSKSGQTIQCRNNTDNGGLCAYAPDANMLWCCPATNPFVSTLIASED